MPYSVVSDHPECSGYAVVKDETNEVMGCHQTASQAQAQLTALNISEYGDRDAGEWEGLNDRQKTQAEDLTELILEYGMFDQSTMANGAHYAPADSNPFKAEGLMCGNCVFFNEENAQCAIVAGSIEAEAVCKLWIIPEIKLSESRNAKTRTSKALDILKNIHSMPYNKSQS
jgi:hypothetical protein